MAHLRCVKHNARVQVIDVGTNNNRVPLTVHRNGGKRNDVCDSLRVTIDGDKYQPADLLDWGTDDYVENFLQGKYDERIYA